MAPEGFEMIVGAVHDPQFGPVLAVGAGGTLVELLKDVSLRIAPLAEREAREMLAELKTFPALTGYRGAAPRDVDALVDIVLRAGALVDDVPEIRELDLNPVRVHEQGATVVDARVRITGSASTTP
jgi:acyl-CoA synthetase (NDP forming)